MGRQKAILLVGPTGSGKTPLGELMESRGLWGRRCCHFDFGWHLRAVVAGTISPAGWTDAESRFVRKVLEQGVLLEEEAFYIPTLLLADFAARKRLQPDDLLVLNGWPRHAGQAEAVAPDTAVGLVAHLDCSEVSIRTRIQSNAAGDRTGRADDSEACIAEKWRVYKKRTEPLLDHYRRKKVQVVSLDVGVDMTPVAMVQRLEQADDPWF